ncbi:flagellar motor switch protein FliN [Thiobaca trueperi]|uniref:Flagellar motor switch protein FliN n=1 Tax=Thiobaca trueperi TaxID=127458 RepID=A0A4R3MY13_9GAMM|nr:flagellar motor switch protein FliN [Thiobaca trueperi]TCT21245.1 flagellar motor switch protein FliN/FliY [Thiobaca trueperi]
MSTQSDIDAMLEQAGAADDGIADDWAAALEEQKEATETPAQSAASGPSAPPPERRNFGGFSAETHQATPLNPEDFSGSEMPVSGDVNLKMLLDVPVTIAMEIGRTRIPIRNLLQLNQGSVVELDRLAGEPLDVLVNGTLIAHGEVVVVNEKFGIRLTDVISPSERVRKLR